MGEVASQEARLPRTSRGGRLPDSLATTLTELAIRLYSEPDDEHVLRHVAETSAREIPGADWVGVTLFAGGTLYTAAVSDPFVEKLDKRQYDIGDGPCIQAATQGFTVRSDDLQDEQRWSGFGQAVAELGVRSMLSVQLFVQDRDLGALNIYSSQPHSFDEDSETVGLLLAAHASVALANALMTKNLKLAVDSRDVIGQAKGVLMERYKLTSQQAFEMLVGASQMGHRKLREVAQHVAETGELSGSA
jgi:GAF domain-containing protein